ncbi:MAG TPA: nuclear transport factor 2 family protein [Verrucomicrobiae bacterium]|nr:nuclear transport factor 2 family protein [Verrucomicrobiae bacterium]
MTSNPTNADLLHTVRELAARVQQLEDTIEIQSLQSKYIHYLFKQRFDRIVDECFARNLPDVSVEFSDSGVYRGLESVRALYRSFDVTKTIAGFFILHMTVNPVIEIAKDGLSARSHWLSPGAAGSDKSAAWIWGTFYVDYVKEDGRWRIAHSNLVPLFRNRYETSWAQAPDHGTVRGVLAAQPDEPSTLYKPYNEAKKQCDIFASHPKLPQPY